MFVDGATLEVCIESYNVILSTTILVCGGTFNPTLLANTIVFVDVTTLEVCTVSYNVILSTTILFCEGTTIVALF